MAATFFSSCKGKRGLIENCMDKKDKTLLVVEDQVIIALSTRLVLESDGYKVIIAQTGENAVELANAHAEIDLILMDINLGNGMDGTEAATLILSKRLVPIIFFSSHTERATIQKTESITSYGYVVKGSDDTILLASIKMAFKLFEANKKVLLNEHRLTSIIETEPECVKVVDPNGHLLEMNAAGLAMLEAETVLEVQQHTLIEFIQPEYREAFGKLHKRVMNGENGTLEFEVTGLKGTKRWLETHATPLRSETGQIIGLLSVTRDITTRKHLEIETKIGKERLSLACLASGIGIWEYDLIDSNLIWDDQMFALYGIKSDTFGGTYEAWRKGLHPEDIQNAEQEREEALAGEKSYDTEFRVVWPDGSIHHIRAFAEIVRDASGKPVKMIGANYDISIQKQAQEVILKNQQHLKLLESEIINANDCVMITESEPFDLPGPRIIYVNKAFTEMTGYTADEVIGKTPRILQGPKTDKQELKRLSGALRRWETCEITVINYKKNGEEFWINMKITPVADETGWFTHWISIERDVTKQKKEELAILESEKRYRSLLANVNAGVVVHAPDTSIIISNNAASKLLGLSDDQLKGKTAIDPHWKFIHEDGSAFRLEEYPVSRVIAEKCPIHNLVVGVLDGKSKTPTWVLVNGEPLLNDMSEITEVIISFTDITALKRSEERLQILLQEKNVLLKEVYHRIKNNTATIEGLLALQIKATTHPAVVVALQDSISRVKSVRVLYDKLLVSEDGGEVSIKEYIENLSHSIMALFPFENQIKVEIDIDDLLIPSKKLFSLGLIVNELITNVMKYAFVSRDSGIIKISLIKSGTTAILAIQDNGVGLPSGFTMEGSKGFGIMLVKMLSEQIHATFKLASENGTRAELTFYL
ncbi:MAG: PAS domain S-box protein [Cyclobacteriaceae bacterium]|nr:PAS domain S-box protein [Cyclobacteriaceae bacterium]